VPEGRGIFGNLSVAENLRMAARPGTRGQRDWTYERVLDTFPRLAERLSHGGQQLSGGEQQMLTIGRALMTNPDVLILDEATEGLAPLVAREIWRICALIRDTGISTVIVDKNWKHVTQLTDRNLILVKGEVVFSGSSAELRSRPDVLSHHWAGEPLGRAQVTSQSNASPSSTLHRPKKRSCPSRRSSSFWNVLRQPPGASSGSSPSSTSARASAAQKVSLPKADYFLPGAGAAGWPVLPRKARKNSEPAGSTTITSPF